MLIEHPKGLLRSYECIIIEIVIAIRLGAQFFVQLMNLLNTGDISTDSVFATYYKYILIFGTIYSLFLIVYRRVYKRINKNFLLYLMFVFLYIGFIYYDLMIDIDGTYHGVAATTRLSTVMNNVLLFNVVAILYATRQLNQILICKIFVIMNMITSLMYLTTMGLNFGDSYDGFLLQSTGFSSLSIGYLMSANIVLTIYLTKSWTSIKLVNYITTAGLLVLFTYILLMCGKTGPTLFAIVTSVFAIKYALFPNLNIKTALMWICISLAILVVSYRQVANTISALNPNLSKKIIATFASGDTSNRDFLYEEAYRQIVDNPVCGNYFELKRYNFYPHNFFLENMITWGLLGTLCMLGILYLAFRKAYHLLQVNSDCVWVGLIFLLSFLSAQTTGSIYGNYRFWFTLTILMVLANTRNKVKMHL